MMLERSKGRSQVVAAARAGMSERTARSYERSGVLPYSNVEAVRVCFSESFEALAEGLEQSLWELGGVPLTHRTDHLGAALRPLSAPGRQEFRERYLALLAHYGMEASANTAGEAHHEGHVGQ